MAWTSAELGADETAAANAGYPVILADNVLRDGGAFGLSPATVKWSQEGYTSSTDETSALWPTSRVYDGYAHPGLQTRPASAQALWYMPIAFGDPQEFDALVIHHTNGDLAIDDVYLQIADNATFSSGLQTICTASGGLVKGQRYTCLSLKHTGTVPLRYSGVSFARIVFEATSVIPMIREVWLGRRRQLLIGPELPYDSTHERSVIAPVVSKSGVRTNFVIGRRGAERTITLTTDPTTLAPLLSWWADCKHGTQPFHWIEDPAGTPKAYLMRVDGMPEFIASNRGNNVRELSFTMREQNPFVGLEA